MFIEVIHDMFAPGQYRDHLTALAIAEVASVRPLLDILEMRTIAHYMCSIGSSGNSSST